MFALSYVPRICGKFADLYNVIWERVTDENLKKQKFINKGRKNDSEIFFVCANSTLSSAFLNLSSTKIQKFLHLFLQSMSFFGAAINSS